VRVSAIFANQFCLGIVKKAGVGDCKKTGFSQNLLKPNHP
jgi:hypothetical protein